MIREQHKKKCVQFLLMVLTCLSLIAVVTPSQVEAATWKRNSTGWWYQNDDNSWPANAWKKINGKWYWFNSAGYMTTGWQWVNGTWYYMTGSGAMAANTWIGDYYVTGSGAMATNTWIGKYYVGADGKWFPSYQPAKWVKNSRGWWYRHSDSSWPANQWEKIGGKWYYFNGGGYMTTGWQKVKGIWYYMESSGAMAANKWIGNYYVTDFGAMATNIWIGDRYVDGSGKWVANYSKPTTTPTPNTPETGTQPTPTPTVIKVTGMDIACTKDNMMVGETADIYPMTIYPANAANKNVTYSSSNTAVATVDGNGHIVAVGEGTVSINVHSADGNCTASASIAVRPLLKDTTVDEVLSHTTMNKTKAQEIFNQINDVRVQNGISALSWDNRDIEKETIIMSGWNIQNNVLNDIPASNLSNHGGGMIGVGMSNGYLTSSEAMNSWMNSPLHKSNILASNVKSCSVSVAEYEYNGVIKQSIIVEFSSITLNDYGQFTEEELMQSTIATLSKCVKPEEFDTYLKKFYY